jgi:hypothetical protein
MSVAARMRGQLVVLSTMIAMRQERSQGWAFGNAERHVQLRNEPRMAIAA